MAQASFDFTDICSNKHHNNQNSVAANKRASGTKPQYRFLCLDYIRQHGTASLEDLCRHFNKEKNSLSGRVSELLAAKLIEKTGQNRNGFAIYRPTG